MAGPGATEKPLSFGGASLSERYPSVEGPFSPGSGLSLGRMGGAWRNLVSAPALGAGGRRFKSFRPDQDAKVRE